MFWGLIMEPGRRYTQEVSKGFHISMATLDLETSSDVHAQVICTISGKNYLLCTLRKPDLIQCPLDLEFAEGTQVSFATNGKAHIHLTGYLTDYESEGMSLEDLNEEEEEEDEESASAEPEQKSKKRSAVQKDGINSLASKKAKLQNGAAKQEESAEEESEDDDFDLEEEDEDASEEEGSGEEESNLEEDEKLSAEEEEETVVEEEKKIKKNKQKGNKENLKQPKAANQSPQTKKQTLKNGVVVEDLVEGSGPPAKLGRFITVYYEGRLQKNNKVFDKTDKGPGFKFRLGAGEVIKGWDVGIVGMKVGGKRKVICPPQVAYGNKGSPPAIPPNSTLVFTVTLKKVK